MGMGNLGRLDYFSNLFEPGIGNLHDPLVGLNGTEGVIGSRGMAAGQGIKDGGFAYIGQANDAAGKTHKIRSPLKNKGFKGSRIQGVK
jgi:hypothetical protein